MNSNTLKKKTSSDQDEIRDKCTSRRKLESDFSLLKENNNIFGPQPAVSSDNLDEIDDDPLILYQACRVMVNNLEFLQQQE